MSNQDKNQKNRKAIYDLMVKDNYNLADFDSFNKELDSEEGRKELYDILSNDNYDVGDYESFNKKIYTPQGYTLEEMKATPMTERYSAAPEPSKNEKFGLDSGIPSIAETTKGMIDGRLKMVEKPIEQTQVQSQPVEPLTKLGEGLEQGANNMVAGAKYDIAETVIKPVVGTQQDDFGALGRIAQIEREGKNVAEETKWDAKKALSPKLATATSLLSKFSPKYDTENPNREIAGADSYDAEEYARRENEAQYDKVIREALDEANGDVEKAKLIIATQAGKETHADVLQKAAVKKMSEAKPTKGWAWIGEMIPQMVLPATGMVLSGVTGIPAFAQVLGGVNMGTLTASTAGQAMAEARQAGASNSQVWAAGILNGAVELVTEDIQLNRLTNRIIDAAKKKATQSLSKAVSEVGSPANKELKDLLSKANKRLDGKLFSGKNVEEYIGDIAAESISEATAEGLQTIIPIIYENPENYPTFWEIINNMSEGAKGGAFMNIFLGGASKATEHRMNRARRKAQGYVDVAEVTTPDGEDEIVEVVRNEQDQPVFYWNGEQIPILDNNVKQRQQFNFDDFERGQFQLEEDEAYENGKTLETPAEMTDANNMYEIKAAEIRDRFGLGEDADEEAINAIFNGDALQAAMKLREDDVELSDLILDYIYAKATRDGIIDAARDRISEEQAQAEAIIDYRKSKNDGMIHPATLKTKDANGNDRQVYIVSGNIVTFEDGSINTQESDNDIIIQDAVTGKPEFATAKDLLRAEQAIDPEVEKQNVRNTIADTIATEVENKMNNVLPFNVGDAYNIIGADGAEHSVQIVADNGDGSVMASIDNAEAVAMPKSEIQQLSNEYNMNRARLANEAQKEAKQSKEMMQEAQNVEPTQEDVAEVAQPQIPTNEQGESMYEQAPVADTWAELVALNEGNEEEAIDTANIMLQNAQKALDDANKTPAAKGNTVAEIQAAKAKRKALIDEAQAKVDYWSNVVGYRDSQPQQEVVAETAPVVEEAKSVIEEQTPVIEETAPIVEEQTPVEADAKPIEEEQGEQLPESNENENIQEADISDEDIAALWIKSIDELWKPNDELGQMLHEKLYEAHPEAHQPEDRKKVVRHLIEAVEKHKDHPIAKEVLKYVKYPTTTSMRSTPTISNKEDNRRKPLRERANEWEKKVGVKIELIESIDEVDNADAREAIERGKHVTGWTVGGNVYLYMPHISSRTEVDKTYLHEVVAHVGMKELLGKDGYKAFCKRVWDEVMTDAEREFYRNYPNVENEEQAADEFIAHISEDVELNASAWQKIVRFFKDALRAMGMDIHLTNADIQDMLRESYLNLAEQNGAVDINEQEGQAMFSIRTYREGGKAQLDKFLNDQVKKKRITKEEAKEIADTLDEMYKTAVKHKNKYAPFGAWSEAKVVENKDGMPAFSVIKKNGDYSMNLDFSTVCKKRRTLDAVFSEMIQRGLVSNLDLDGEQIAEINNIIRRFGFETACALCFVDAKRFRVAQVADKFCEMWNPMAVMTNRQLRAIIKAEGDTVRSKVAKYLLDNPDNRIQLKRENFIDSHGFEEMEINNPEILSLYKQAQGTSLAKIPFGDVQYLNDLEKRHQWTPDKAYAVGGVRLQSFSDYVPRMFFDYMQLTADLAAKNLPVHAYTKEPIFAKQFGLTGMKINLSLVPKVVDGGVSAGLDADGNYAWMEGETFPYEEAMALQNAEGYRENCGTIAVGVSDAHIEKLLDDPNIRMVIPYHKSGLNPLVAKKNRINEFVDYTNVQNTRSAEGTKLNSDDLAGMPNFNALMHYEGMDARQAAQAYLDWCDSKGYLPKFDKWRNHPNYYKLLEDFTTIVPDANGVETTYPQTAVTMTFPTEDSAFGSIESLIREGLEEDAVLEGRRDANVGKIVDTIEEELVQFHISPENEQILFRTVYHGSGAKFDKFDYSFMGTGEGNQAFGWGAYVTEVEGIGKRYAEIHPLFYNKRLELSKLRREQIKLSENIPFLKGKALKKATQELEKIKKALTSLSNEANRYLYSVEIPDDNGNNYIYWDREVSEDAIKDLQKKLNLPDTYFVSNYPMTGERVYKALSELLGGDKVASKALNNSGYVGISYPADGGNAGDARNYVIFNEADLDISDSVRFRFIGEAGASNLDKAEEATIRLDNLAIARLMEYEGNTDKSIKMTTGWERGADDKWRYEVNDDITAKHIRSMKGAGAKKILEARSKRMSDLDKFMYIVRIVGVDRLYDDKKILATSWSDAQKQNWLKAYEMYKDDREGAIEDIRKASAEYNKLRNLGKGEFILYEVLGNDHSLFKEYPQLRNVNVVLKPYKGGGDRGNYNRLTNTITIIDFRGIMENDKGEGSANTLVHEIQHIIQSIEGFARGGNTIMDDPRKMKAKEAEVAYHNEMFENAVKERRDLADQASLLNEKMYTWWNEHPDATWEEALRESDMYEWNKAYSGLQDKIKEAQDRVEQYERNLEEVENIDTSLGLEGYKRLAGEVEARNVGRRRNMSLGERRNSPAWLTEDVARKDQIFIYDALGESKAMFRIPDYESEFADLQREYDALDKNDEQALNTWRDKKVGVVEAYLYHIADLFGMKPEIAIFNGADEAQMREAYNRVVEAYNKRGNTPLAYDEFKKKVLNKKIFATYYRGGDIIVENISTKNRHNSTMRYAANLFHEVAHHHAHILYGEKKFEEIWDSAVKMGSPLAERISTNETYKDKSESSKGNEFLAHSIAALVREYKPLFQQFVSGRNNVAANDLVTKLGYKNTKINFALTKILNRIKDEYQESRSRVRGNISEGVGDSRPNRVPRRVLQNSIPQQDRGGVRGVRDRGGFVLEPIAKDVAQRGLREMVGEQKYNDFLMRALRDADEVDRRAIVNAAMRNGLNFLESTESHLASLAESNNIDKAYLNRVKNSLINMLANAGIDAEGISNNDVRYLLWRNLLEDNGAMAVAEDVLMQQKLGVGNFRTRPAGTSDKTMFRTTKSADIEDGEVKQIRNKYDKKVNTGRKGTLRMTKYNFIEANQDEMRSLKEYQKLVKEAYGIDKLPSYLDVYALENRIGSAGFEKFNRFVGGEYEVMQQFIDDYIAKGGETLESVIDYARAKSGLERNREFTVRDYIDKEAKAKLITKKEAEEMLEQVNIELQNDIITPTQADARRQQINNMLNTDKNTEEQITAMREQYKAQRDAYRKMLEDGLISYADFNIMSDEYVKKFTGLDIADYSGLSATAERMGKKANEWKKAAADIVEAFENKHDNTKEFWSAVKACNDAVIKEVYDSGMISKQLYDHLKEQLLWYIPMSGFTEDTAEDVYSYIGGETGAFTPPVKKASGRLSESDDPFAIIANKMQGAILQGNRNRIKLAFLNLIQSYPTDLVTEGKVWLTKQADGTWEMNMLEIPADTSSDDAAQLIEEYNQKMRSLKKQGLAREYKNKLNVPYVIQTRSHQNDHEIIAHRNGQQYVMYVNGNPQLAKAINGKLKDKGINLFYKLLDKWNRIESANKTSWNPDFIAPNVQRDFEDAVLSTFIDAGVKDAAKLAKTFVAVFPEVVRSISGSENKSGKYAKYFEEFMQNGGETGYSHLHDVEKWKDINQRRWKRLGLGGKALNIPVQAFNGIGSMFSYLNRIAEDSTRFAAYVHSRQKGRTIGESIKAAKDITTNFNKKGSGATEGIWGFLANFMRRWFLFYNPMVQGIYKHWERMTQSRKRYALVFAAMAGAGYLAAVLNKAATDDDDEEKKYFNQSDYTRRTNIMIYTGDGYIKIPLAPVFREMYALGDIMYSIQCGVITPWEGTKEVVNLVRSLFNLEGQSSLKDQEFSWSRFIIPQSTEFMADIEDNVTFTGTPLYKDTPWNKFDPEYQKVYNGTWTPLIRLSKAINDILPHEDYLHEVDDQMAGKGSSKWINPAVWQHIIEDVTGGVGKTIGDAITIVDNIKNDTETDLYNIPIAKRFYAKPDERTRGRILKNQYYDAIEDLDKMNNKYKKYTDYLKANLDLIEIAAKTLEYWDSDEGKLHKLIKDSKSKIDKLNRQLKEAKDDASAEEITLQQEQEMNNLIESIKALESSNK